MVQKPDFQAMPREDLRAYVLSHRDDDDALRIYMDRLRSEPGIVRYQGGLEDEDFIQLNRLLQKASDKLGEIK